MRITPKNNTIWDNWVHIRYCREDRSTRRRAFPSATLFTTKPTWTVVVLNLGLRGKGQATNRLYGGMSTRCLLKHKIVRKTVVFIDCFKADMAE